MTRYYPSISIYSIPGLRALEQSLHERLLRQFEIDDQLGGNYLSLALVSLGDLSGYPSMRNPSLRFATSLSIASLIRSSTTVWGTSWPASMIFVSSAPRGEPDLTSARRRSPDERCERPYLATIFSR
ncbi:hypothetical protein PMAYCL1PPCAC_27758, partial [Pristionchus mayeri]